MSKRQANGQELAAIGGEMTKQLNMGDLFPEYVVQTVNGGTLRLLQDLYGEYSVLIFYRGSW